MSTHSKARVLGSGELDPNCAHCYVAPLLNDFRLSHDLSRQECVIAMINVAGDLIATDIALGATGKATVEAIIEALQTMIALAVNDSVQAVIAAGVMKPRS